MEYNFLVSPLEGMRQCPECKKVYYDETLNYCLEDGAALIYQPAISEPATEILNIRETAREGPTRTLRRSADSPAEEDSPNTSGRPTSQRIRRISAVAGVLAVALLCLGGYWFYGRTSATHISSIAVMPFVNESGNQDIEYLSDGMTETLISSLTQLPDLAVKPRSSVFRYKGKDTDAKTVGKELNVGAILNGTVAQRGVETALHVELIDTSNETLLWSRDYKRPLANLVALQSEVTRDVIDRLKIKLNITDEQKVV